MNLSDIAAAQQLLMQQARFSRQQQQQPLLSPIDDPLADLFSAFLWSPASSASSLSPASSRFHLPSRSGSWAGTPSSNGEKTMAVRHASSFSGVSSSPLPYTQQQRRSIEMGRHHDKYRRALDEALERLDFDDITVMELKDNLRRRGLPSAGKKSQLIERLREEVLFARERRGVLSACERQRLDKIVAARKHTELCQMQAAAMVPQQSFRPPAISVSTKTAYASPQDNVNELFQQQNVELLSPMFQLPQSLVTESSKKAVDMEQAAATMVSPAHTHFSQHSPGVDIAIDDAELERQLLELNRILVSATVVSEEQPPVDPQSALSSLLGIAEIQDATEKQHQLRTELDLSIMKQFDEHALFDVICQGGGSSNRLQQL